jgi:hypothetical protein
MRAYSDSKLANILLTVEPESRLSKADSRVRAVAAHPGIARTNLAKAAGGASARFDRYLGWLLNDVRRGALPIQYAASQDVPGGSYIGPNGLGHLRGYPEIHQPSRAARDPATAHRLWELSTRLTGNGRRPGHHGSQPTLITDISQRLRRSPEHDPFRARYTEHSGYAPQPGWFDLDHLRERLVEGLTGSG